MITLLEILLPLAAHFAIAARVLLWQFNRCRPFTEPLSCDYGADSRYHEHWEACYRQRGILLDSAGAAFAWALFTAAFWPAFALAFGVTLGAERAAARLRRPSRQEVEAKTRRLERELGIGDKP